MRLLRHLFALAACLALCPTLRAGSAVSPLDVTASVTADCRIAVSDLTFGSYDPLGQNADRPLDGAADVTMRCTRSSRAAIVIDYGRQSNGGTRALGMGAQQVAYQLYRDEARTKVWGEGGDALQFVSDSATNPQQFTVYGRIPPGQEAGPGVYTDVVTATVEF
jgi:spore coat protein U-like protein